MRGSRARPSSNALIAQLDGGMRYISAISSAALSLIRPIILLRLISPGF